MPSKKHKVNNFDFYAAAKGQIKKSLNLNIYRSKNLDSTKEDENYERRVQLKDLLFYMQKDP